jgi:hypothetical protein
VQDTPISSARADKHVIFNQRVFIQTPLDVLRASA